MLGKLLKYEFKYLIKEFTRYYAVYGALLVAVILMFQLAMLEKSSSGGFITILFTACLVAYVIYTILLVFLTIAYNVRRFKRNMFSQEGYLTNTLPVTPEQHIIAKVIAGGANCVVSYVVIFFGLWLLLAGFGLGEDVFSFFGDLISFMNIRYVLPTFLAATTGFIAVLLCFYLAVAISSMIGGSKGKAILLLVGAYIAYMVISSMISASFKEPKYYSDVYSLLAKSVYRTVATRMYILALLHSAIAAGEFFAIVHIIKNKLNLQ